MTDVAIERTRSVRIGWALMVVLGALLVLNGAGLYAFIETSGQGRTVGLLVAAFGALTLDAGLAGRGGHGRAWRTGWVVAAALAALALHMVIGGAMGIAGWYGLLTGLAVVALLLARPG